MWFLKKSHLSYAIHLWKISSGKFIFLENSIGFRFALSEIIYYAKRCDLERLSKNGIQGLVWRTLKAVWGLNVASIKSR